MLLYRKAPNNYCICSPITISLLKCTAQTLTLSLFPFIVVKHSTKVKMSMMREFWTTAVNNQLIPSQEWLMQASLLWCSHLWHSLFWYKSQQGVTALLCTTAWCKVTPKSLDYYIGITNREWSFGDYPDAIKIFWSFLIPTTLFATEIFLLRLLGTTRMNLFSFLS